MEAKLHHLGSVQSTVPVSDRTVCSNLRLSGNETSFRPPRSSVRFRTEPKCYNCGSSSHLFKQCPHLIKQNVLEATGHVSIDVNTTGSTSAVNEIHAAHLWTMLPM